MMQPPNVAINYRSFCQKNNANLEPSWTALRAGAASNLFNGKPTEWNTCPTVPQVFHAMLLHNLMPRNVLQRA
jgi:hypothetical protein